jgi:hypothetical protein
VVKRPAGALWLALRVTIARRGDVAATSMLAMGAATLTFLALATVAAREVGRAQQHRSYSVTPKLGNGTATIATADSSQTDAALRTVDPRLTPMRRWHEHDIVRSFYSAGRSASTIPGVGRPPRADEYYASPALRGLMRRDATVAALFSGKRLIGTIADEGLVQPHELRAVVGVARTSSFLLPVAGFGSKPFRGFDDNSTLNASVASIVLLAVWLPGLAVLVIVTGLGSGRRRRRSRALRLLGASVWMTRAINALETIVVALPASLLGCLLYWTFIHRVTTIPWTSFGYFTSDAQLGTAAYLVVALVVTVIAGGSNAFAFGMETAEAGAVHARPPSRIVALGLVLIAVGLGYLFALPALAHIFSRAALGLWIACGFVSVGLAVAGPRLVMKIADVSARRVRAGGTLVGLRLNSWATTTSSRLGSMLCVIIVMLLGGLSFMSILNGGSSSNWMQTLAAHPKVPVIVNDFGGALTREDVLAVAPGTGAAQVQDAAGPGHGLELVYADCRDLAYLSGAPPASCTGRPQWIRTTGSDASLPARGRVTVAKGHAIELPSRADVTLGEGLPQRFDRALLLPPRLAPPRPNGDGSDFYLLVDNTRLDTTLARLSAQTPSLQFDLGALSRENPDDKQFPTQLRWLTTGSILGLLIGSLALLVAALGDTRERATGMRGLRIIGAPQTQLLQAHYWSTSGPIVILGWIATLCGWLVCRGIRAFDDRADIGTHPIGLTALAVLITGLAIATVTWPDALRATHRRAPRRAGTVGSP